MQTASIQPHTSRLVHCLLLLAMAWLPAASQTTPTSNPYRIAGTVVNSLTGEPVRRATVAALGIENNQTIASAATDNDGHFALENLAAAKYTLTASKRGFRTASYDEHDEYSSAIVTGEGQDTAHLKFLLTPVAVLSGVVTGDAGDQVEGAKVMLFLKPHGHARSDRITQVDMAITDDTGAYEFGNLAAGEYLLAVKAEPWYAVHRSPNRARPDGGSAAPLDVAYPVTYFDSTTDEASAAGLVLAGGSREEANINLHAVPALHLGIEAPPTQEGAAAWPELRQTIFGTQIAAESQGPPNNPQEKTVEFTGVAPGRYEIVQGIPPRIVDLNATVSEQIDPSLSTPTLAVTGTLLAASGSPLPDEMTLTLNYLDGPHPQESMVARSSKGQFKFDAVSPGTWELAAITTGRQWPVVSIAVGNRMRPGNQIVVRDRALSVGVTVAEQQTRLEGFARKNGKGEAGVMVVLVPADKVAIQALGRRDQSDTDGSFALHDVAPGQYTIVAIEDGWELDWTKPEIIGNYLANGVGVTIPVQAGKVVRITQPVPVQAR